MKKKFNEAEIVSKLRRANVQIRQDKTIPDVCREINISQQTYYAARFEFR